MINPNKVYRQPTVYTIKSLKQSKLFTSLETDRKLETLTDTDRFTVGLQWSICLDCPVVREIRMVRK